MAKRIFDLLIASLTVLIVLPFMIVIGIVIRLDSRGPILYKGVRIGRDGRRFKICKFRTMRYLPVDVGPTSTALDDPRITRVGHFLRHYKLDELPQLFNVIAGTMSLVGPRPEVGWAVELYTAEERRLLSVKPGMTDWASIRFNNEGEILAGAKDPDELYLQLIAPEKRRLGLEYVDRHTVWGDTKIILQTIATLFEKTRAT